MLVKTLPVGQMAANCHLVILEDDQALIIDPGDDADLIIQNITEQNCQPTAILATHGHFDHIMAAFELQLAYNIPFLIHPKDQFLLKRMQETANHFLPGTKCPPPPAQVAPLQEGKLTLDSFNFTVIPTPGHTPGSVCLYFPDQNILFAGDLLFAGGGYGRTDFSYSNILQLQDSIEQIMQLPADTTIFCGHGRSSTVEEEKNNNLV
jgi:glyoxylase-like metal-dependent hydrolase (beta-lactamase superfamily II)